MSKKYICTLADNQWGTAVANLLNRYSRGENLAPQFNPEGSIDLNKIIKAPTVAFEPSPETLKTIKLVGFALAGAVILNAVMKK